jgi:YfiR/HmsC-like
VKVRHAFAAWLTLSTLTPLEAQPPAAAPEDVEAAYLYQFGHYVDWPPDLVDGSDTFEICVLGMDRLGAPLDEIVAGKAITGRQVAAKKIAELDEAVDCRILFVSSSENERVPEILKELAGMRMLTVGRGADFTKRGGMIGFTSEERRVRFVVNLAAADSAKLMLSSQLLRVAVRVDR